MTAEQEDKKKSKRKRKGSNPSTKWPQVSSKTDDLEERAKQYLCIAGLKSSLDDDNGEKSSSRSNRRRQDKVREKLKQQEEEDVKLDHSIDLNAPEIRFGRLLGSTDERVRHSAVLKLAAYLKARCEIKETMVNFRNPQKKTNPGISELELMKLWKGLWHTLYMADKVPVQDELSSKLANLIWSLQGTEEEDEYAGQTYLQLYIDQQEEEDEDEDEDEDEEEDVVMEEVANTLQTPDQGDEDDDDSPQHKSNKKRKRNNSFEKPEEEEVDEEDAFGDLPDDQVPHCRGAHLASLFMKTFFVTLRREWGRMDKYRVDKFYTLIRFFMAQVYTYMAKRHWNRGIIFLFNDALFEEILMHPPNGLRLHLLDIVLQELAKVNREAPLPLTEETFLDVINPFISMAQQSRDQLLQARMVEKIFIKFLETHSILSDTALDVPENVNHQDHFLENLIFDQVHVGNVSDYIFELAGSEETQTFRETLYDLYKTFARRLKKVGKDIDHYKQEEPDYGAEEDDDNNGPDDEEQLDNDRGNKEEIEVGSPDKEGNKKIFKEEEEEETNEANEVPSEKKSNKEKQKRKKKKKKKREKNQSKSNDDENGELSTDESSKATPNPQTTETPAETDEATVTSESSAKKKKKNKKKSNKQQQSDDSEKSPDADTEQFPAASKHNAEEEKVDETKAQRKKRKKKKQKELSDAEERRVSFGKTNRAISFKASMKNLRRCQPTVEPNTPERSILRNKTMTPRSSSSKKKRKTAADFF